MHKASSIRTHSPHGCQHDSADGYRASVCTHLSYAYSQACIVPPLTLVYKHRLRVLPQPRQQKARNNGLIFSGCNVCGEYNSVITLLTKDMCS